MTQKQLNQTRATLVELQEANAHVEWHVTYNYYTKLPEFTAVKHGGVHFQMFKRERREIVKNEWGVTYPKYTGEKYCEMSATYDRTTHADENVVVSGAHDVFHLPQATVKTEMPRVNFKKYIQFIKDNMAMLELIGA